MIKRLARDLAIPTAIEGGPTVREPDGLAMSSRNLLLSPEQRRIAPALFEVLRETAAALAMAARPHRLDAAAPTLIADRLQFVDYVELRDADAGAARCDWRSAGPSARGRASRSGSA